MDDEGASLMESLRRHWQALLVFAMLVAAGAIYAERKFFAPAELKEADEKPVVPATPATPPKPAGDAKTRSLEAQSDKTQGEKPATPPTAGAESPADSVSGQTMEVAARPVVVLKGQGKWDDASKTLSEAIAKVTDAVTKAGLAVNGRPLAVFTQTDDAGFHFEAMAPLTKAPEGKPKLPEGFEIGSSPAGKALKFQHRGAYDEIDATYEAIAAYLDEKGLDTKDLIIEEYLTDFKNGDDASIDVDIYVFVK